MNLEEFLTNQTREFQDTPKERKQYRKTLYIEGAAAAFLGIIGFGIHNPILHGLNASLLTFLGTDYLMRARGGYGDKQVSGLIGILKGYVNKIRKVPQPNTNPGNHNQTPVKYLWSGYLGNETKDFETTPEAIKGYRRILYMEGAASILLGAAAYFCTGPMGLLVAASSAYAGLDYIVRGRGGLCASPQSGIGGLVKGYLARRKARANQSGANPSASGGSP